MNILRVIRSACSAKINPLHSSMNTLRYCSFSQELQKFVFKFFGFFCRPEPSSKTLKLRSNNCQHYSSSLIISGMIISKALLYINTSIYLVGYGMLVF